jgi:dimethylhistidine N-methyltransferase
LAALQSKVLYQPIDISPTALEEARAQLESDIPGITVQPCEANYVTGSFQIARPPRARVLALYIGSSIGNFSPEEARSILGQLRSQLQPGDALLLGTDLAPSATKPLSTLLAAYNDQAGVTAAFNRNILVRLNRELGANFRPDRFAHRSIWNSAESRIEMHLESIPPQRIHIPSDVAHPALNLSVSAGETIHTENSYKFTEPTIRALLSSAGFVPTRVFSDTQDLFAVTLARAN